MLHEDRPEDLLTPETTERMACSSAELYNRIILSTILICKINESAERGIHKFYSPIAGIYNVEFDITFVCAVLCKIGAKTSSGE